LLLVFIVTNFLVDEKKSETHLITGNINVRVKRETANKIDIVPLEEYIVGVLAGEMPISFELEAFKAQAGSSKKLCAKKDIRK
jgi:stage II sporulation protein D